MVQLSGAEIASAVDKADNAVYNQGEFERDPDDPSTSAERRPRLLAPLTQRS